LKKIKNFEQETLKNLQKKNSYYAFGGDYRPLRQAKQAFLTKKFLKFSFCEASRIPLE